MDKYEVKVDCNGEPASRDKKYGVAVISAIEATTQSKVSYFAIIYNVPFHGSKTAEPSIKCIHRTRPSSFALVKGTVEVGCVPSSMVPAVNAWGTT